MTTPNSSNPELHGLDPAELLARGINTAHPSGPVHEWTPPTPEELARLLPQYQIESLIGRGGMGAVYKGYQANLDRSVAIKLLPAELTADDQFVTRFQREAKTLAKLQHPGIVSICDFGQTSDGHLYFVMEYVEGTDLRHILLGPGLDPGQALEIITQICEALHAAHLAGVIHRDIKPANILITSTGRVKLADFGLARPDREEHEALTMTNAILGTPDYMAPEQREGQTDLRADIYALGVMLYEMLTGQLPRGAWAPPSRKVQVDVRIDEVVLKALQQEPDLRYQQASEMKTDVDTIRSGASVEASIPAPASAGPSRRRWLLVAAALGGIALAVWGFANFQASSRAGSAKVELSPTAGPMVPARLPSGAVEKPIPGVTNLRRFVWTDQETGLFTRLFFPAQADSGLCVRMRFSPDLLSEAERAEGHDFDTLWEWAQVPSLAGEGENTIILKEGIPVWHRDKDDHNHVIRLLSGIYFDSFETGDLAFADRVSNSGTRVTHTPEGIRFVYSRKVGERIEPFLDIEIRAVPHAELKAMFSDLRGPGETVGEVATWDWAKELVPLGELSKNSHYGDASEEQGAAQAVASSPPTAESAPTVESASTPTPEDPMEKYRNAAYKAALRGDAVEAKALSEQAIALDPDLVWNWASYGWCLFNLDLYTEALAAWRKAYQLDATAYGRINVCLALAYDKTGDEKEALRFYSEQVKIDADFGDWDVLMKTLSWQPNEIEALYVLYKKWIARRPEIAQIETLTASAKRFDKALFDFRWDYVTKKPTHEFSHSLFFQPDGFAYSIGRGQQWRFSWEKTGPASLRLKRERDTMDLTFDETFERFTGNSSNGWTAEGSRTRPRSPKDREMLEKIIAKLPDVLPNSPKNPPKVP